MPVLSVYCCLVGFNPTTKRRYKLAIGHMNRKDRDWTRDYWIKRFPQCLVYWETLTIEAAKAAGLQ